MTTIDERIASLKFDNAQFESGVKTSMDSLGKLNKSLQLQDSAKNLDNLAAAGKRFDLSGIANGVDALNRKISALGVMGMTAIMNLTNSAINAGRRIANSFTLEPIMSGFHEYETQINAVQTILANTASKGSTLKDVNGALNELNTYADKTIYNFTEMTRNIGTFTAAGVDLDKSVSSIKGIANLAATSGSNAQQASTAMYQLSQAIASGSVKLMDWNSVVNAGMGGQVFQDALKRTARNHGIAIDKMIKKEGSFRETLQKGWLSSQILTETLSQFTGDMTEKQLKAQGYGTAEIKQIMELAKTANDAATKVKTVSQLYDTLKEAAQSGWTQSWQLMIGDFNEAKKLLTEVSNVLGNMINVSAKARNQLIGDWKKMGGRAAIIKSIQNIFEGVLSIIKPVKEAFRDIFPPVTAAQLTAISKAIERLTSHLKLSSDASWTLRKVARGLFAILDIGRMFITEIVKGIVSLIPNLSGAGNSMSKFAVRVSNWLYILDQSARSGHSFVNVIRNIFSALRNFILQIKAKDFSAIFGVFNNMDFSGIESKFQGLQGFFDRFRARFEGIKTIFGFISKLGDMAFKALKALGGRIVQALGGSDYNALWDIFNTGLFAGIIIILRKVMGALKSISEGPKGGKFGAIKDLFENITGALTSMQQKLKAEALMKLALALALMAASVLVLSLIDPKRLAAALGGLTVMMGQLFGMIAAMDKTMGKDGATRLPVIAASLVLIAAALDLMALAVAALARIDYEGLAKGTVTIGILLAELAGFMNVAGGKGKGIKSGGSLILLAVALNVLALAVKQFGGMDVATLGKGLISMALALGIIAATFNFMPKSMPLTAAGLLIASAALVILAGALKIMGSMSWGSIAKSMVVLAGSLIILAGGLTLMIAALPGAAALIVASGALVIMALALKIMGSMSWGSIAKSLVTLAGALLIIAAGLTAMIAALPGAAALIVVSGALVILAGVLVTLGSMSWMAILKGLSALAGVFLILGLAGLLLAPLTTTILGLGAAILLMGVGMALVGVGVLAFTTGIVALMTAFTVFVTTWVTLWPVALTQAQLALQALLTMVISTSGLFVTAIVTMLVGTIVAISAQAPIIVAAIASMLLRMLNILVAYVPQFVDKGFKLLLGILKGIRDNIGQVVDVVGDIIVNFLNAMARKMPEIVTAGTNLIVNFIDGISNNLTRITDAAINLIVTFISGVADGIETHKDEINTAAAKLGQAVVDGVTSAITGGISGVVESVKGLGREALSALAKIWDSHSPSREFHKLGAFAVMGVINGLSSLASNAAKASANVGRAALNAMKDALAKAGETLDGSANLNPRIRPVVDLTDVQSSASKINDLLQNGSGTLNLSAAYDRAQSAGDTGATVSSGGSSSGSPSGPIIYNQYNNSPKALSRTEIYRQTNNQLKSLKGALAR